MSRIADADHCNYGAAVDGGLQGFIIASLDQVAHPLLGAMKSNAVNSTKQI